MIFTNDSTSCEIFDGPLISSFLHKHELFSIPFIKIGGFDERVHDTILAMLARAVDAEVHAQVDGGPGGILLLAVDADLNRTATTLFLFIFFSFQNAINLVRKMTHYLYGQSNICCALALSL